MLGGAEFITEVRKIPVFDGKKVTQVITVVRDLTGSKHYEEALQESEERFRRIFEEGPLGMAIIGSDYRLIKVNHILCRLLGYKEQEFAGLTFSDITHPDDIKQELPLIRRLSGGEIPSYNIEKRLIHKEGKIIRVNVTASVIRDAEGKPICGLAIVRDITERKQMEGASINKRGADMARDASDGPMAHINWIL